MSKRKLDTPQLVSHKKITHTRNPIIPLCTSYLNQLDRWCQYEEEQMELEEKLDRVYPREMYVMDPPKKKSGISGEQKFKQFEWLLENGFEWKRHLFQKEFHLQAAMVLAPQIIGDDWDKVGPVLVRERKWSMQRTSKMLLGRGPRRFGKSISVAMLAAAYVLVTPKSVQSIFSTAQRISVYLGQLIYKAICDAGYEWRIKKFGEESMEVWGPNGASDPSDIRKVFYYPANAKIDECTHTISFFNFLNCIQLLLLLLLY